MGYYSYRNESTNITVFEPDGTMRFLGDATVWNDREFPMSGVRINAPGSKVNASEMEVLYSTNCPLTDYAAVNIQMSHGAKMGSAINPHLHWVQQTSNFPNWIISYRWQYQGQPYSTTWTFSTRNGNAFTYSGSELNQITKFTDITPSSLQSLSDIVQFRVHRDSTNGSSMFASTDPYAQSARAVSFDVHYEIDTVGSRSEYSK